jgi:hypothetical protein
MRAYSKAAVGQLLYDLAFVKLTDEYLARKHKLPISEIRRLRELKGIKSLTKQWARDQARAVSR